MKIKCLYSQKDNGSGFQSLSQCIVSGSSELALEKYTIQRGMTVTLFP